MMVWFISALLPPFTWAGTWVLGHVPLGNTQFGLTAGLRLHLWLGGPSERSDIFTLQHMHPIVSPPGDGPGSTLGLAGLMFGPLG